MHPGMTHWQYMDEPQQVITRELRIHAEYEARRRNRQQPQEPKVPTIA